VIQVSLCCRGGGLNICKILNSAERLVGGSDRARFVFLSLIFINAAVQKGLLAAGILMHESRWIHYLAVLLCQSFIKVH